MPASKFHHRCLPIALFLALTALFSFAGGDEPAVKGRLYEVIEFEFAGPMTRAADRPTDRFDFKVTFEHEASGERIEIPGFWDGDGNGQPLGKVYKVRFTPTAPGIWRIAETACPGASLHGQREGERFRVADSDHPGFWLVDDASAGGRWFKRSNGSRPYFIGNTHYDFLFRPNGRQATPETIRQDIRDNAAYFGKLRGCIIQPRPENADTDLLPFFDRDGRPTRSETDQPNPAFFARRVDVAVKEAARHDLIFDIIMGGTTGDQVATKSRFVKYVCARYGAYPNVWFTVGQEWNEQTRAAEQVRVGNLTRRWLAYPTPISTHATSGWTPDLNGDWHTHAILQGKISNLAKAAGAIRQSYRAAEGKPCVNDENGYDPGEASTGDVIEGILGSFLGGGYGSTGHKTASKQGGYFWGHAALGQRLAEVHPSAAHLKFLRDAIQRHLPFWRLRPLAPDSPDTPWTAPEDFPAMADRDQILVLGSNRREAVRAALKSGQWEFIQIDAMAMKTRRSEIEADDTFAFHTPESRAALNILISSNADFSLPLAREVDAWRSMRDTQLRIQTRSADLESPRVGADFTDDLEASGGRPPYEWEVVAGRLPPGLRIVGSEITGIPTRSGAVRFTLRVTDSAGEFVQRTLELSVTTE